MPPFLNIYSAVAAVKYLILFLISLSFSELAYSAGDACPFGYRNPQTYTSQTGYKDELKCTEQLDLIGVVVQSCELSDTGGFFGIAVYSKDCAVISGDDSKEDGCYPEDVLSSGYCNEVQECESPSGNTFSVSVSKSCDDYCTGASYGYDTKEALQKPFDCLYLCQISHLKRPNTALHSHFYG